MKVTLVAKIGLIVKPVTVMIMMFTVGPPKVGTKGWTDNNKIA